MAFEESLGDLLVPFIVDEDKLQPLHNDPSKNNPENNPKHPKSTDLRA
jgi:hypothetical protein